MAGAPPLLFIKISFYYLGTSTDSDNDPDAFASARELLDITLYGLEADGEPFKIGEYATLIDVYMPDVLFSRINI